MTRADQFKSRLESHSSRPTNSHRWADLVIRWDKDKPYAAPPRFGLAGTTEWTDIKIPREQVMKLWPSAHAAKPPEPTRHDELEKPLPAPTGEPLSEEDARLKNRIEAVLAVAKRCWPDHRDWPSWRQMAAKVRAETGVSKTGFNKETIRKILSNRYPPMRRLRIDGLD